MVDPTCTSFVPQRNVRLGPDKMLVVIQPINQHSFYWFSLSVHSLVDDIIENASKVRTMVKIKREMMVKTKLIIVSSEIP